MLCQVYISNAGLFITHCIANSTAEIFYNKIFHNIYDFNNNYYFY